jgi:predicted nucleotidyltransferase component of viral defense system
MLQIKTVDQSTLALLKSLMALPCLSEYRLVGGTSLALQLGHRKSIDIDLFGETPFNEMNLHDELKTLGEVHSLLTTKYIRTYTIESVKVDIVNYTYSWIDTMLLEDGIRLATPKEIAAMKINAIANRGSKKDFFDLHELLNHYSLKEMVNFYKQKYPDGTLFMVFKSLTYFEDAEEQENPISLNGTEWIQVKNAILKAHEAYMSSL